MIATAKPNRIYETTVTSYCRKHTLWQAIAEGSEIRVYSNVDRSITVNLICGDKVVAHERPVFKTRKAQDAAMAYAAEHGKLEIVAGSVVRR